MAAGLLQKLDSTAFLGRLYLFKCALPHLSALSKTFQTGSLNFSKIAPSILKTKTLLRRISEENTPLADLKSDLNGRLLQCEFFISERDEEILKRITSSYIEAICRNIDARFPQSTIGLMDAFSVFDVVNIPSDVNSAEFQLYGS